jgi:hypothetical protein
VKKRDGTKVKQNITSIMSLELSQINFIKEIKEKIRNAQYEAMKAVNVQLINLYWEIGRSIAE